MIRNGDHTGEHERRFDLFGTSVRVLVGSGVGPRAPRADMVAAAAEAVLRRHQRALSRFDPHSELSVLNHDPRAVRELSELTAGAVAAALWAAEHSGGLIDPTLLPALERAGYVHSLADSEPAPLYEALSTAPPRRPAAGRVDAKWRELALAGRSVRRPPGVRLDLGGTAKGLAADRAAAFLAGREAFAVDAGGDVVVGGRAGLPRRVTVAHPLDRNSAFAFDLATGAVATSGVGTRLWRTPDGFGHHLLDPSTGRPAWTGVIQATAVATSGLEAEVLAKVALLSGPDAGFEALEPAGGVLVLDSGDVVVAGRLQAAAEVAA